MKTTSKFVTALAVASIFTTTMNADEITDWNYVLGQAILQAGTSPAVSTRVAAIVQAAVFDAVNGIERRYTPIHVQPAAPSGASRRAAAVAAAYGALVQVYPNQKSTFDQKLAASLAAISSDVAVENSVSVVRGIEWGLAVANAIWTWRSTDGFTPAPPPFLGGFAVGQWRPTPPLFLPGAVPQLGHVTPWAIGSPSQFRPVGPPALDSAQYTADFNEVKSMGSFSSSSRTTDQTIACQFWTGNTPLFWNRIAVSLGAERHTTLSENARLLALLNIAMADAGIACWEAKYHYVFWRPVTAIPLAATDGNAATIEDPSWTPLLVTPAHPEYPSGHSIVSGAAATVLADYFGENTFFAVDSETAPGVVRTFASFSAAQDEIANARVFGGIHFRTACVHGRATGLAVANYILEHALLPVNGNPQGQIQK